MAALIASFTATIRQALKYIFPHSRNLFLVERTPYGLPIPLTPHKIVSEEELSNRRLLVIGDVHGCYDELVELLDTCGGRDPSVCVVFVGDLCNKGPKSPQVVRLARQLGAYCVRGNHDEVSLRVWQDYAEGMGPLNPKFAWMRDLGKEDLDWLFQLPFSIRFPSRQVLVVHGGVVPGIPIERQKYDNFLHLRDVTFDLKSITYSEHKPKFHPPAPDAQPWSQVWQGPEHVYFGHDARRFLQVRPFAIGLDTACVYGHHLTAVFDDDRKNFIQVKSRTNKGKEGTKTAPGRLS